MKITGFRFRWIDLPWMLALLGLVGWGVYGAFRAERTTTFASRVDLHPLYATAVQGDGRLRSFESHAKTYMSMVSGGSEIDGQPFAFTYLDLILRPEKYAEHPLCFVKNKPVRAEVLRALHESGAIEESDARSLMKTGLFSRELLQRPEVSALLDELSRDLIRTAKPANQVEMALGVSQPSYLLSQMRIIPPPSGEKDKPWLSTADLTGAGGMPRDSFHSSLGNPQAIEGLDPAIQSALVEAWSKLGAAWRDEDVPAVNAQIARIAELAPQVAPGLYPARERLHWESWYFRSKSMTWVWLVYLASAVPLLMSVIYRWNGARRLGMALFALAFLLHTGSVALRWYISGRWPNANMFEAVTTSVWFGGVAALVIEWFARRSALRNLFALCAATASMAAFMVAYFAPAGLDSAINNKMAALYDVWLYIHTNVIIASYALIALAAVMALLQLRHRWCLAWDEGNIPRLRLILLPIAMGVFNYTAYELMMHHVSPVAHGLDQPRYLLATIALASSGMLLLYELLDARRRVASGATIERSAAGGAAALLRGAAGSSSFVRAQGPTIGQVFDGATMVLMELSFITLWTGIIMGAVWADHSWGRPWGWDPKEVFALNTFLILIALIHVRLKVRDKGLWTAILAVLGFEVMLFNWIVINFIVTGLHSYA
jgi:ABC-type transport system involved in cytochrome c biogenesis permease subunit